MDPNTDPPDHADEIIEALHEDRLWRDNGWTAQIIKNEDDDGWAVAMTRHGDAEPALVGPWTMGRDKKNPKPLDTAAFHTLVKTASEVIRRHEQQRDSVLHQQVFVTVGERRLAITLDIVPDDDDPYAHLEARTAAGESLARVRVAVDFRLNARSAAQWVESDFARPR